MSIQVGKRLVILCASVAGVMFALSVAGCSTYDSVPSQETDFINQINESTFVYQEDYLAGTWEATSVDSSDEDLVLTEQEAIDLSAKGLAVSLVVNAGGSARLNWMGETSEGEWENVSDGLFFLLGENEYEAELADDTLLLICGDDILCFTKVSNSVW